MSMPKGAIPPLSEEPAETAETTSFAPNFDANGLLPVVVTSASTGEVLMLAYMTREALARTIETGEAHYWSRSRGALWRKGEISGNTQRVVGMRIDCDQDALWLAVEMGGAEACCHTGHRSCFYRAVPIGVEGTDSLSLEFLATDTLFDPKHVYGHAAVAKGTLKTPK